MVKPEIIALSIFLISYALIGLEKIPRLYTAVFGALLLIFFRVFTFKEAAGYIDLQTIGFLFGIFLLIKTLAESGFFNYLALKVGQRLNYSPLKILVFFPMLAWFLSSFMDSITVLVFMSALTYALSKILKFDPVPVIVAEVCLANIGGSGTLMGDPPNIILGAMFNLGFTKFITHNGPISFLASLSALLVIYLMNRKKFTLFNETLKKEELKKLSPEAAITDKPLLKIGLWGLGATVFLLVGRDFLHKILPMELALTSLLPAFTILTLRGRHPRLKDIIYKIDLETILFFIGLFVIVGSLEKTGLIQKVGQSLFGLARRPYGLISLIFWGGVSSSAFVDNVPMAMSFGYLIRSLHALSAFPIRILVWTASLGLDIGGNLTPIGASANIVAYSFLRKEGVRLNWYVWFLYSFLPTISALIVCHLLLLLKYKVGFY
ncbi:MAG: SLC13 family permease [Candidatus Omnitrophota bacterium]